ncbi:MAG: type II secretion system F family protein [Cyanobacteria bacterium]|nr:type II secretion system F family protein [Cyanobacteriota bacterium]MDA1169557.1 type II secretion system F family protein [Cyanobacteriota bacterium]
MNKQTYIGRYLNSNGREQLIQVNAYDLAEAKRNLRQRGILALDLKVSENKETLQASMPQIKFNFEKRPGAKDKALFANKLAALVGAGVPIVRSLDLITKQQRQTLFKRALQKVSTEVSQGGSLADSLRLWPQVFDPLMITMVEAGEAGGVLEEVLRRLAKLLENNAKLQNQIRGALGYPLTVLLIAVLVFLGMTILLIPTFAEIFKELGAELPAFTILMLNLSAILRSPLIILLGAMLIFIYWLIRKTYRGKEGRLKIDGLLLKLPVFGDLIEKTDTAQFCRTFSSLSRAGVPILMSLKIVADSVGNKVLANALVASRLEVQEGSSLSQALGRQRLFPAMALSLIAIGEETGQMDVMLSKIADFYEDEIAVAIKTITTMLEPAMIVIVGAIVGSILLAMYLPMFSVFNKIS